MGRQAADKLAGDAVISNHRNLLDTQSVINLVTSTIDKNPLPSSSHTLQCVKDAGVRRSDLFEKNSFQHYTLHRAFIYIKRKCWFPTEGLHKWYYRSYSETSCGTSHMGLRQGPFIQLNKEQKLRQERLVPHRGSTELVLPVLLLRRSVVFSTGGRTRATHPAFAKTFHQLLPVIIPL